MDELRTYADRRLELGDMIRAALHLARGTGDDQAEKRASELLARPPTGSSSRVVGQFSRSKTTLMSALLGGAYLPMGRCRRIFPHLQARVLGEGRKQMPDDSAGCAHGRDTVDTRKFQDPGQAAPGMCGIFLFSKHKAGTARCTTGPRPRSSRPAPPGPLGRRGHPAEGSAFRNRRHSCYLVSEPPPARAARPASRRATGTRNGEQDT